MLKLVMRGVLVGLALSILAPAGARAGQCPAQPVAQRFLPWADPAWYAALPGGGFEPSTPAWTLAGGAAAVEGNEPFYIGGASDYRSLRLPAGASATSPAICLGADHPTLRLLVSNSGSALGSLTVSAGGGGGPLPLAPPAAGGGGPAAPPPVAPHRPA